MRDGDWNPPPSRIPIPILAPCTTWASGGDRFWCYYCHGFRTKAYYYYCHGSCDQLQEEDDNLLFSRSQFGWSFRNSSPRESSCTAVAAKAVPSFPSPPFRIFSLSLISLSSSEIESAWWTRSILFFRIRFRLVDASSGWQKSRMTPSVNRLAPADGGTGVGAMGR
jgi:hypothetical protein